MPARLAAIPRAPPVLKLAATGVCWLEEMGARGVERVAPRGRETTTASGTGTGLTTPLKPMLPNARGTSGAWAAEGTATATAADRKSTRLNSSHLGISYAVFCLKK